MKTISKQCPTCLKLFNAPLKEINRGFGKYCTVKCVKRRTKKVSIPNVICAYCQGSFYKSTSKQKGSKSNLFFCCRNHKDLAQRIGGIEAIQPNHYNNGEGKNSYRNIAFEHYPKVCNRCSFDKYSEILIVHHRDRNRSNNVVSNLEVLCPNCHALEHYLAKDGLYNQRQ